MASGGLAVYGGGALGPVILSQFIPAGNDPSYVGVLIADAVIFVIAPIVFTIGWSMIRKKLYGNELEAAAVAAGASAPPGAPAREVGDDTAARASAPPGAPAREVGDDTAHAAEPAP